jgi:hypothetical protein
MEPPVGMRVGLKKNGLAKKNGTAKLRSGLFHSPGKPRLSNPYIRKQQIITVVVSFDTIWEILIIHEDNIKVDHTK